MIINEIDKYLSNVSFQYNGRDVFLKSRPYETLERIEKIAPWLHKRKFLEVTESEQRKKVEEETEELYRARFDMDRNPNSENIKNYYFELADCLLSIKGLERFDKSTADLLLNALWDTYGVISDINVGFICKKLLTVYFVYKFENNHHAIN